MSMILRADDFKVGQYVAVCGYKNTDAEATVELFRPRRPVEFDGMPLEILAISLPFLCVASENRVMTIDVRRWDLCRINTHYVRETTGCLPSQTKKKRRTKLELPDTRQCPRCGQRLVALLNKHTRVFENVCKECGYNGGQTGVAS